jgi:hypothetical protein
MTTFLIITAVKTSNLTNPDDWSHSTFNKFSKMAHVLHVNRMSGGCYIMYKTYYSKNQSLDDQCNII